MSTSEATNKKWQNHDAAFAWGVMCRYPEERMILELLFDSTLEMDHTRIAAISNIASQLGTFVDRRSNDPEFDEDAPMRHHGGLLSIVIRNAFKTEPFQTYRKIFSLGWDFGQFLWSFHFGDLEDEDSRDSEQLESLIKGLPGDASEAFDAVIKFIKDGRNAGFERDKFPKKQRITDVVERVSTHLRYNEKKLADLTKENRPQVEGVLKEFGRVQLRGRDSNPNAFVDGSRAHLAPIQFTVISALVDAGEDGLTKDQLNTLSEAEDGIGTLKQIRNNPTWKNVIKFPGGKGRGGYRIAP